MPSRENRVAFVDVHVHLPLRVQPGALLLAGYGVPVLYRAGR